MLPADWPHTSEILVAAGQLVLIVVIRVRDFWVLRFDINLPLELR